MSENTYHITGEDVRKMESRESKSHGGNVPKDSDVSAIKVCYFNCEPVHHCPLTLTQSLIAENQEPKQDKIGRVQANLPLPEDPPGPSDWNSADARTVNVGSGGISEDISALKGSSSGLREPATAESSVRVDGEELKTNTAP